jgi:hypothetical protein
VHGHSSSTVNNIAKSASYSNQDKVNMRRKLDSWSSDAYSSWPRMSDVSIIIQKAPLEASCHSLMIIMHVTSLRTENAISGTLACLGYTHPGCWLSCCALSTCLYIIQTIWGWVRMILDPIVAPPWWLRILFPTLVTWDEKFQSPPQSSTSTQWISHPAFVTSSMNPNEKKHLIL